MAKLNKSDMRTESNFARNSEAVWKPQLEIEIARLPSEPTNLNEREIWKNALSVETLMKSRSK
jgi:hypothetical protein